MSATPDPHVEDDVLVTADGYKRLCAELEALRTVRRAALTEQLREAHEDSDPDNPLLFDLLEEQAQLEGRISVLQAQVAAAQVVRHTADGYYSGKKKQHTLSGSTIASRLSQGDTHAHP